MKACIFVDTPEEIEEEARAAIQIFENPPEGADPEDEDDPHIGEDGTLVLETTELEVEGGFPLSEFPQELDLYVDFTGWDETEERVEAVHGLESHEPADVTITLKRKWQDASGKSVALYAVALS
jgi:hypothetical protein